jgi:dipeptidyl aminopeptidase/acylaminoacyl peptidase
MPPVFLFLIVILLVYILATLVIGRYLLYQDILPRKIPNGKTELAGYDYKDIEFKGFDGITLRGWYIKSPNNPSNKIIFLLPGWTRVRSKYLDQIKFFVDSGFHVFTYDQRSHGASDTGLETYGPDEAKDLLEAIKYAGAFDSFDKDKIVAVGFSLGAFAIIYAAGNQAFKAVVLEGVASNSYDVGFELLASKFGKVFANIIGNGVFKVGSFVWTLGKFRHSSPIDYVGGISPTPVMIIRGENDERVPSKSFMKFMEKVKEPKEYWVHDGYHTSAYMQHPDEYSKKVVGFLDKYLK